MRPPKVQAALPPGLDIVEVVPSPPGALADLLAGSRWAVDLVGAPEEAVQSAVVRLLGTTEVEVERMTKNGLRRFDAQPAIFTLGLSTPWPMNPAQDPEPVVLEMTLAHTTPVVRPDDVVAALVAVSPDVVLETPPVLTRLAQGVLDPTAGMLAEPAR